MMTPLISALAVALAVALVIGLVTQALRVLPSRRGSSFVWTMVPWLRRQPDSSRCSRCSRRTRSVRAATAARTVRTIRISAGCIRPSPSHS